MSHSCKGCMVRWTGMKMSHCAGCHETFSTPSNFDRHRRRRPGKCTDPAEVGLVKNKGLVWKQPMELETHDG